MSRLHRAVRLGKTDEVVDYLAQGDNVDAISVHHFSALMLAAREGHLVIVQRLLEAGADTSLTHPNQRTALHFAAGSGHLDVVKALVAHGASLNALNRAGKTAAIEAAQFNHRDTVLFLQQQGTDMSIAGRGGLTAEDWLAEGGVQGRFKRHFPVEPWLSQQVMEGSERDVRRFMAEGLTADEYAAKHGRRIIVWSYGNVHFSDPDEERWAHRVAEILFTSGLLAQCEERCLQGEELEDARKCRARRARSEARWKAKKANA